MKTMTCAQLGGPATCDHNLHGNTFEEISEESKKHGMEMFQKQEPLHMEVMKKMMEMGKNADEATKKSWMEERIKAFEATPDDA